MDAPLYTIRDANFWKITIGLGLASLALFAYLYSFQPILPILVEEFNISVAVASFAMSLSSIGLMIGLNVLGFLSDRHGRMLFIYFSLIGSLIPVIIFPFTHHYGIIIALRFLQGFAIAGLHSAALAYIGEEIAPKYVKIAISFYIASNAVGGMMGRVVTGTITEYFSWQASFYLFSISGFIITLLIILIMPKSRHFKKSSGSFIEDIKAFGIHLKTPALLILFGLGIVLQITFTGIWTYAPFHLIAPPFSLSLQMIANLFFAYSIGVVGAPLTSMLASRFNPRGIVIIGILSLSLGVLLTRSYSLGMIVLGLCVLCFGFFTAHSLTTSLVAETATHHKGTAASLYFVAYYLGTAFGSSLLAPLWEYGGWNAITLVLAVLPVIYTFFLLYLFQKQKKEREAMAKNRKKGGSHLRA